jgi:hydroxymethylpyrimidine/phosphomethylpyrimidine kinase
VLNSTQARAMATEDMTLDEIARDILQECQHVLMTGTHENTVKIINRLYDQQDKIVITEWERIPGHFHGRSNTLSAALAGMLAQGLPMEDAVKAAQAYTWQALKHSYRLGMGKYFLKQSIDFLPE